jgi:hypothetical protein
LPLDLGFRSSFGDMKLRFFVRPSIRFRIANANRNEFPLLALRDILRRLATFRRKIHLSRIEVIWNVCWKDDTPPAIPAGCLVKSFVIFGAFLV